MGRRDKQQDAAVRCQLLPQPSSRRAQTEVEHRAVQAGVLGHVFTRRLVRSPGRGGQGPQVQPLHRDHAVVFGEPGGEFFPCVFASLRLRACLALNRASARTAFLLFLLPFFLPDTLLLSLRSPSF